MDQNVSRDAEEGPSSSSGKNKDCFEFKDCETTLPGTNNANDHYEENSDDEYSDAKEAEELDLDDEAIKEAHKDLSEYELQKLKEEALTLKSSGNDCFKNAEFREAITFYTKALNICPLQYPNDRSVLYGNRAASRISLEQKEDAVLDCNKAIELNPEYLRVILRRAQLHRKMDNLERSLEDYQKVLELDQNNAEARRECAILPPEIEEKNEKLKTEMFGKLKELGNMCLKPFGLSTENFKVVQDPNSGGYSVNFQNNT